MNQKNIILLAAMSLFLFINCQTIVNAAEKPVLITSPGGQIQFVAETKGGALSYRVSFNKIPVIESSLLGLTVNGKVIGANSAIGTVERYAENKTYAYRGVHSLAVNNFKAARIHIGSGSPFVLDVRVFNDGVAFRYLVKNAGSATIESEATEFTIPAGTTTWLQNNVKYYEGKYVSKSIAEIKAGELAGPPVTLIYPNGNVYAAITEGGLTDYAGMSLIAKGNRTFQANLSGITKKQGNFESPWRIIEIGKDLNTLVNCDIVANVSPAFDPHLFPKGYQTDWVKPGRSVWSWLAEIRSVTLPNMKAFSDLAAELGFEYNLVDEGWSNWKDGDRTSWDMMKELVDYSATKGVKIWVWKAYPDRGGIPGIKDPAQRKAFFQKCKDIGIAGMKVDFFDNEDQEIVKFYQAGLKDAAEYHLMMDFHGANKPTGETRTWPNEMTREAIRGMENRPPWAEGNTVFPFTRYLAGHSDFTPIHFGNRMGEVSWAHHIASMAVFTSPFLCIGADPKAILANPAKEMIKSIPPTWDETIVLPQSKIANLVLYARRKGTTWFLAAMNGTADAKELTVDLSFLKKGTFKVSSVADDKTTQAGVVLENKTVTAKSAFPVRLNSQGGFIGRFEKE